jgi:hypothetical protein
MNHASEHDIDRVLTALRDTQPTAGLEARILQAVEDRTPSRSTWSRWNTPMQWSLAALATAAILLAVTLTAHNTQPPTSTIAQTGGDPSSPEASSPAKVGPHSPTSTVAQTWGDPSSPEASSPAKVGSHSPASTEASPLHATRGGEVAAFAKASTAAHLKSARIPTYPPHKLLCDCDPLAMAEMQAPSHPAPEMPLTAQERLLQRVVRHDDPIEVSELEPFPKNPLRSAVTAKEKEDDAVKDVVQRYLKQLAAAEALNPTAPTPTPVSTPVPDSTPTPASTPTPVSTPVSDSTPTSVSTPTADSTDPSPPVDPLDTPN